MKVTRITKALVATVLLAGSTGLLIAQSVDATCPFGNEPGYGRNLTPAERGVMLRYVDELREFQAAGMLTAEEQVWLEQFNQYRGACVSGARNRRGGGKGQGQRGGRGGQRSGRRSGMGACDGTGPRSGDGTCLLKQ